MTRAERRARNKRAHALRRAATEHDYRAARAAGRNVSWRDVWDGFAALDVDTVLSTLGALETETAAPATSSGTRKSGKRSAPAHIRELKAEYDMVRAAWERGLEEAMAGGRTLEQGGRPANGETYPDEERDYRAAHPAPTWKAFLQEHGARVRADLERGAA